MIVEHRRILSVVVGVAVMQATLISVKHQVRRRPAAAKELALSLTYLRHLKKDHKNLKLALLVCSGLLFAFGGSFPQTNLPGLVFVPLGFLGLLVVKELLVEYRIRKGLFGTNRTEAQALIHFIVKNSNDIDFTDSNGKLRRALLPEAEGPAEERNRPLGEGVPV